MKKLVCGIGVLLLMVLAVHAIDFQLEVITNKNDPLRLELIGDSLFAATEGGLVYYHLQKNEVRSWTTADGFADHRFTALAYSSHGLFVLGSESGAISFFAPANEQIANDFSLQGEPIQDLTVVDDTLWIAARHLVAVYVYQPQANRYEFRDFFGNFDLNFDEFTTVHYARKRIWVGSKNGLLHAPADFIRFNLKSASTWAALTTADGLPGNQINDIEDSQGNLLLATNNGLAVYDFQTIATYQSGLVSSNLKRLRIFTDEVYAADNHRIYRFVNNQFELLFEKPAITLLDFTRDAAQNFWAGGEKEGFLNLTTGQQVKLDGPRENYMGQIFLDSRGRLWCSSGLVGNTLRTGVFLRTEAGWKNFLFSGPEGWSDLSSTINFMEDSQGNIWCGSWGGGIVIFEPDLTMHFINRNTQPGTALISTPAGNDTVTVQTEPQLQDKLSGVLNGEKTVVVTDIFLDRTNECIWIINYESVTNRPLVRYTATAFSEAAFSSDNWRYYVQPLGNYPRDLLAMTQDIFGYLWIATGRDGALRLQFVSDSDLRWEQVEENDNLKSNALRSIAADEDGFVWFGTRLGLSGFLNNNVFDFREDYHPIGLQINDIFVDSQNNKWFATDKGISLLKATGVPWDGSSWVHIVPQFSDQLGENIYHTNLPSEKIHGIVLDERTGDIYASTEAGLAVIRHNPFAATFADFEQLKAGPLPFVISEAEAGTFNIYNLIPGSEVKILTPSGQLVRTLDAKNPRENLGTQAVWDGRNEQGELVSTGVYLYLVTNENGKSRAGKVLVIRK